MHAAHNTRQLTTPEPAPWAGGLSARPAAHRAATRLGRRRRLLGGERGRPLLLPPTAHEGLASGDPHFSSSLSLSLSFPAPLPQPPPHAAPPPTRTSPPLPRTSPCAQRLLARVLVEVSSGLAYLHQNEVMHRDIKTANVLLDGTQHAKVTGLVSHIDACNPHGDRPRHPDHFLGLEYV